MFQWIWAPGAYTRADVFASYAVQTRRRFDTICPPAFLVDNFVLESGSVVSLRSVFSKIGAILIFSYEGENLQHCCCLYGCCTLQLPPQPNLLLCPDVIIVALRFVSPGDWHRIGDVVVLGCLLRLSLPDCTLYISAARCKRDTSLLWMGPPRQQRTPPSIVSRACFCVLIFVRLPLVHTCSYTDTLVP